MFLQQIFGVFVSGAMYTSASFNVLLVLIFMLPVNRAFCNSRDLRMQPKKLKILD